MAIPAETQNILRHWQTAVPNDRLAHLVKDATRAFVRALQSRLTDHAIPFGHWSFLRVLWERDGLTQRQLSEEAGVMEPTTFAAVKAMEAQGFVERRRMPGNNKNNYVFLTERGLALRSVLIPLAQDVNTIGVRGVSAEDIATTKRVLLSIIANLAEDEILHEKSSKKGDQIDARVNGYAEGHRPAT
jgi:DNA-binding MarR family transcriptional regulator